MSVLLESLGSLDASIARLEQKFVAVRAKAKKAPGDKLDQHEMFDLSAIGIKNEQQRESVVKTVDSMIEKVERLLEDA